MKIRWQFLAVPSALRLALIVLVCGLMLLAPQARAQSPSPSPNQSLPRLELPQFPTAANNTGITTGAVQLDGHKLFTIAVPAVSESDGSNRPNAITARVESIQDTLNRLANQPSNSRLEATAEIEASSNLPVISVNGQYVMTVTTLDAQLQGQQPTTYARELTQTIRNALLQARRERQPDFLIRQGLLAIAIFVAMLLITWALSRIQQRLRRQRQRLHAEMPAAPAVLPNTMNAASNQTGLTVKRQLINRQRQTTKDVQRRLLQLAQLVIWLLGGYVILGLFPYSRSLQPIVVSTPLQVLSIAIAVYLLIRFSDLVIDRIFSAFSDTDLAAPDVSQRVALRASTFSRVAKSLAAIAWIGIGITTLLGVIGIQVLPLLAGAGIIGLGISLASQNLIKDVINGFFILLEDQYAVGDIIQVGKATGLVEHMSLRITQLRNAEGRLITIPNSTIGVVENLSKDWSRVDLAIAISYDADLDRAIEVILQVGTQLNQDPDWQSKILEPPQVLGVDDLNSQGVTIRVWIKTQPLQQWHVAREFRRRLKQALDQQGIAIGVPQQVFSVRGALTDTAFGSDHSNPNSQPQVK